MKGGHVGFLNLLFTFLAKFVGAVLAVSGTAVFILVLCVPALAWYVDGASFFKELKIKDIARYLRVLFGAICIMALGAFLFLMPNH